jgi:Chromo (CHRromatin Organisation MOdifier) domain
MDLFEVLQRISPVTYWIKLPQTWKIHNVFHVDLLTPYYKTPAYGIMHSQPPPELIDGEEEYEVEEIIDHRTFRRKKQYLVKWLGYPMSENSWVNEKDLHSPQLL